MDSDDNNRSKSQSKCFGCQNRSHEAPLSPAQCYPDSVVLNSCEDSTLVVNSAGSIGSAFLEITDKLIDTSHLTNKYASCDECGAIATFLGTTRNHFGGRRVDRLEYESYTSMALHQMKHIVRRVFSEFAQVHRVVISHRIGVVPVREASVFIAVTTEHRESGLAAVAFAINTLKERVPVWKREFYVASASDGSASVEQDAAPAGESTWKRNCEYSSPTAPRVVSTTSREDLITSHAD